MVVEWNFLLLTTLLYFLGKGHCLANFIDPPSGTTVVGFEADVSGSNVFTCNLVFNDAQITTTWSIRGLGGVEGLQTISETEDPFVDLFLITGDERNDSTGLATFRNRLTILNFTEDIKDATLFCGPGSNPEFANFPLRLYLPPSLRDNYMIKIMEGTQDVMVDLSLTPEAFPTPQTYQWTKDGNNVNSNTNPRITYTYPTTIFKEVVQADTGNYSLSASNYVPMNSSLAIGNDDGDFELDVLFGPEFDRGVTQRAVLLGDPLSLVCGKNLVSNPMATIEWRDPNEVLVADNARYDLEDGPEVIRLNFTRTIEEDEGEWTCRVRVTATDVSVVQGDDLVVQPSANIGTVTVSIALTVVVPPSEPRLFDINDVGATWADVCWQVPESLGSPPSVSRYEVVAMDISTGVEVEPIVASTEGNETQLNVTDLLPGTVYVMSARAISEVETDDVTGRSGPSNTDSATTGVTVPAPNCLSVMSSSGDITVNWDYIHTGGLELTAVEVDYSFQDLLVTTTESAGDAGVNDRSLVVPRLLTGRVYTFTVTASNIEGNASSECPPVDHRIGVPQAPLSFTVTETGEEGGIAIVLVTNSAGVGAPPHSFNFDVSYGIPGRNSLEREFPIQTYTSGEYATVTIEGLDVGELYIFSARARNQFGSSDYTQGPNISITASSTPPAMTTTPDLATSSNVGAVSTAAAVSISAVICSLVFFVGGTLFGGLVVYIYMKRNIQITLTTRNTDPANDLYEDVGALELDSPALPHPHIELNENAAYGRV